MSLEDEQVSTYEEFEEQRKHTDHILEYFDGVIYMAPSPSIKHQRISSYLQGELHSILKNNDCEVFAAPTDVLFEKGEEDAKKRNRVVPDLFVTCQPENFTKNEYIGAPEFIIEILSPSNQAHDLVRKLNLYMEYGVQEYWIVDPMENRILIYSRDENAEVQFSLISKGDEAVSNVFHYFKIDTANIF